MRHINNRLLEPGEQLFQSAFELQLTININVRNWLIEQDDLGLTGHFASTRHFLARAVVQFVDLFLGCVAHFQDIQHFVDASVALGLAEGFVL